MNLFEQFDALFQGRTPENLPHPVVVNRFLASDPDYAEAAATILDHTWDSAFTWEVWRLLLPRGLSAPRMRYTAAKKAEVPAPLVQRIMTVDGVRREIAEEKIAIATLIDNTDPVLAQYEGVRLQLCRHYGVDPEEDEC